MEDGELKLFSDRLRHKGIMISGFADEISTDFDEQLAVVKRLGMEYISLRTADGKGIADYTAAEAEQKLLPRLKQAGIKVSSLGSPIGKIRIDDDAAYQRQLGQLDELGRICGVLDCRYIRMFSFFIPETEHPSAYTAEVERKIAGFLDVAKRHGMTLIHENEKDIYGDIDTRCLDLMAAFEDQPLAMAFDFANFVQCGVDPWQAYQRLRPYVKYIHIKDAVAACQENVVCGTGEGRIADILHTAIQCDGYRGFLTLEPHLVLFDALASLEQKDASEIIKENKAADGAAAYEMQYQALLSLLNKIK